MKDPMFLDFLNKDINILLETWKGGSEDFKIEGYNIISKVRKKTKKAKRHSGGIIVMIKKQFYKGISYLKDATSSQNRLWLKLDKYFFGLKQDLYLCAVYIPPFSSAHYDSDLENLENEISSFSIEGQIILIGDFNSRTAMKADYIENDSDEINNFDGIDLLPESYITDIDIRRVNQDSTLNTLGNKLLELCSSSRLRILNGRFLGDSLGYFTYMCNTGFSTVDYAIASESLLPEVKYFKTNDFTYLSDHVQINLYMNCSIISDTCMKKCLDEKRWHLIKSYKWTELSSSKLIDVLSTENVKKEILDLEMEHFDSNKLGVDGATEKLNKILQTIAENTCKVISKPTKKKKKKIKQLRYLEGEQNVELHCCHPCIKPVIENFKAILMFQNSEQQTRAIECLEKIRDAYKHNLNIQANLAEMYKQTKQSKREEDCKKNIERIIHSPNKDLEKARSLAEQGYILMIDLHSETTDSPEKKIMDFGDQVKEILESSSGRIQVAGCESILKDVSIIRKKLLGLHTNCHKETTQERKRAVKTLAEAIKSFENILQNDNTILTEVIVWKHYLGKAYHRLSGGSDEILSGLDKKIYMKKAVEFFEQVAVHFQSTVPNEKESRILARTYAYIACIYIQKKHRIKSDEHLEKLKVKGITALQDPMRIAALADEICSKHPDRVTFNRLGILQAWENEWSKAEEYYNKSIVVYSDYNWFAYSLLCQLYLDKHVVNFRVAQQEARNSAELKKSKEYVKLSLEKRKNKHHTV
ncbi:unnamed protein product [Mytilus edulis]|uniref:Endonuclease/exonuclease/phosphatase domain-containing protein n=1 Tax=Mytilus edulis TaxID=6550 RepID=A0A8S3S351_MYTED|nr:unnamed protein product [Mytilus edulis]